MATTQRRVRFCIVSDLHCNHEKLKTKPCDFLIICGDITKKNKMKQFKTFENWLRQQPAKHILLVFGNHEKRLEKQQAIQTWLANVNNLVFINNNVVVIDEFQFFGRHYPFFSRHVEIPFNSTFDSSKPLIILSHEPPFGIMDYMVKEKKLINREYRHGGSKELQNFILNNQPQLHCFGHCHSSYGVIKKEHTMYVNAAVVNDFGYCVRNMIELEYNGKEFIEAYKTNNECVIC
ncbi:hypothetical protein QTN25_002117 [Entamoeba marina]